MEGARAAEPHSRLPDYRIGKIRRPPNRLETFACIASLETGFDITPAD